MALSKPTNGSNADYANRIGLLFDAVNNGNYPFPAAQVPSADANTLDDYEEGTWTPSIGGTATYTNQTGRYTKIGRAVLVSGTLLINAVGTGSVSTISGLPFTSAVASGVAVHYYNVSATSYSFLAGSIASGASIVLYAVAAGGATGTGVATFFANSANIVFSGHFSV